MFVPTITSTCDALGTCPNQNKVITGRNVPSLPRNISDWFLSKNEVSECLTKFELLPVPDNAPVEMVRSKVVEAGVEYVYHYDQLFLS